MRLKHTIPLFFLVAAIAVTFLVLQSSTPVSKDDSCKESMDASCNKKKAADKMIWENLSQQFFS
ncbi:MAG TPA: hypothetical protein VJ111_02970, partial [Chitinophagaceae bacterium]|nr:hypothetical protein [Chitinophagaceae bacterium]